MQHFQWYSITVHYWKEEIISCITVLSFFITKTPNALAAPMRDTQAWTSTDVRDTPPRSSCPVSAFITTRTWGTASGPPSSTHPSAGDSAAERREGLSFWVTATAGDIAVASSVSNFLWVLLSSLRQYMPRKLRHLIRIPNDVESLADRAYRYICKFSKFV